MNKDLDKDLQSLFDSDCQELPAQPFARQTLQIIKQSDLAFRRIKNGIGFLITLTALIIAPLLLEGLSLFGHFTFNLLNSDLFIPVFISFFIISFLLSQLKIVRLFW